MRVIIAILIILGFLCENNIALAATHNAKIRLKQISKPLGKPKNGGKPAAPFTIQANLGEIVPPETDLDLQFSVSPHKECAELKTLVRGLDGVLISGEIEKYKDNAPANQNNLHAVKVRVGHDTAGYAVIDVSCKIDGATYSTSKAIPLRTSGMVFKKNAMGVKRQEKDRSVIILRPDIR